MKIRLLRNNTYSGALNMGIDEMLFERYEKSSDPVLRFYTWEKPTLSLGYFQRADRFRDLWDRDDIQIVRRMTGGRGVIHHLELTYSVTGGFDEMFKGKDLQETYRIIAEYFTDAFNSLGVKMDLSRGERGGDSANCFDAPSLYEMTIAGMKVIGSAQYRSKGKFIQHGSIVLNVDHALWSRIYGIPEKKMKNTVKGINDLSGLAFSSQDVAEAIMNSFSNDHEMIIRGLSSHELSEAEAISAEKYASKEYTYRR